MDLIDHTLSIDLYSATGSVYFDGYSVEGVEVEVDDGSALLRSALVTLADDDGEPVTGPLNRAEHSIVEGRVETLVEDEWTAALHNGFFDFDDYDESDLRR